MMGRVIYIVLKSMIMYCENIESIFFHNKHREFVGLKEHSKGYLYAETLGGTMIVALFILTVTAMMGTLIIQWRSAKISQVIVPIAITAIISTTVICIAMGALLSLMLVSLQWAQRWQIENEVLLESMTIRLTIVNFTKRADKTVTVGRTGQYILYDGVRWFGIEGTEARRVLSDGQKQALSSPTISPSWGRLIVTPLIGGKSFEQFLPKSPIHMNWQVEVKGTPNTMNANQYKIGTDITVLPNLDYFQYSPTRS